MPSCSSPRPYTSNASPDRSLFVTCSRHQPPASLRSACSSGAWMRQRKQRGAAMREMAKILGASCSGLGKCSLRQGSSAEIWSEAEGRRLC
eukprot:864267-Rhodomonas_salina.2